MAAGDLRVTGSASPQGRRWPRLGRRRRMGLRFVENWWAVPTLPQTFGAAGLTAREAFGCWSGRGRARFRPVPGDGRRAGLGCLVSRKNRWAVPTLQATGYRTHDASLFASNGSPHSGQRGSGRPVRLYPQRWQCPEACRSRRSSHIASAANPTQAAKNGQSCAQECEPSRPPVNIRNISSACNCDALAFRNTCPSRHRNPKYRRSGHTNASRLAAIHAQTRSRPFELPR